MRTRRPIVLTAAPLVAALVTAGCSSGSGDKAATSQSTTATHSASSTTSAKPTMSSTSPSPTSSGTAAGAPGVPEPARQHTKAGAKAFAEYFYARANAMYKNPSRDLISKLYKETCSVCSEIKRGAVEMQSKKQHFIDDQTSYKTTRVVELPGGAHVFIQLTQRAARMVNQNGMVVSTTPAGTTSSVTLLDWRPGKGWIIEDLQHE